jgi:hypothetical protein
MAIVDAAFVSRIYGPGGGVRRGKYDGPSEALTRKRYVPPTGHNVSSTNAHFLHERLFISRAL